MPIASPDDVLTFWFAPGQSDRWYAKDEAFDAEIRQRFLPTYEAACSGHLDAWREGPDSLLALIIVLETPLLGRWSPSPLPVRARLDECRQA